MNILAEVQKIALPDETQLNAGANAALRMAQSFTITSAEEFELAAGELKAIKAKKDALTEKRMAITRPMDAAKAAVMDLFRGPIAALEKAENLFKGAMLTFQSEQERIAAEARRRAEEEAAAERRRLEEEARRVREAAEAEQRRIAEAEAERVRLATAERQRLEDEAAAARAAGNAAAAAAAEAAAAQQREADAAAAAQAEQAAATAQQNAALEVSAIEQVSAVVVAVPPAAAPAKVAGISTAKTVDFEVTDLFALVKHIAANPALINLVRADDVKLRAYVRSLGMSTNLPGVKVGEKKTLRAA